MRVLIVDSESLITAAIESLLSNELGIQVVGSISLSTRLLAEAKRKAADVLLVYLGVQGSDCLPQLARVLRPTTLPVVAVSGNLSKEHVAQVLQAGIRAFVPQNAPPKDLKAALQAVQNGSVHLPPSLPAAVRQAAKRAIAGERTLLDRLTERQRSILKLIAEGRNTKEIAHRLRVSVKTVEFHRVRLMNRLGIYNVPGLVRFAIRCGVVRFDG